MRTSARTEALGSRRPARNGAAASGRPVRPKADPLSGTGSARVGKDGRLRGTIWIKDGDSSTFAAVTADDPEEAIPPPSYRDK